jgi:hypothetical protein
MTEAAYLRDEAQQCRRLAEGIDDPAAVSHLESLARDLEQHAAEIDRHNAPRQTTWG